MRIIRNPESNPQSSRELVGLRAALGLDQGLVADWQRALSDGQTPLESVREVLTAMRKNGDEAVVTYTEKFDRVRLSAETLRVPQAEIDAAVAATPAAVIDALVQAAANIRQFQVATMAVDPEPVVSAGRRLAMVYRALRRVGVYVPGGATAYPSSVLMTVVPAQVAGVEEVVVVSPPAEGGRIRSLVLAACGVAGVTEVYRLGGAVAVAALAYGTKTIRPVDKIVGPGNLFVQLAKKEVQGQVDIDMFAGPSEVLVIADSSAEPGRLAADLLSQAEHNPGCCILVTDDPALGRRVEEEIKAALAGMKSAAAVRDAVERFSAIIEVRDMDEACRVANFLAPEHLQIQAREPRALVAKIRSAGAVFVGPWTPVAVGDYFAGPSHTLPTGGTARFASGLSANDFRKRMSVIEYTREALAADAAAIVTLAEAEVFEAHARSVTVRLEAEKGGAP
jgi:histidinol dehydrogenase